MLCMKGCVRIKYEEYENDATYKVLIEFCSIIGIKIIYKGDQVSSNFGNADDLIITMPVDDKIYVEHKNDDLSTFDNNYNNNISRFLASEIAHFLIKDLFNFNNPRDPNRRLLNSCCDQIGNGLYLLAKEMANKNSNGKIYSLGGN